MRAALVLLLAVWLGIAAWAAVWALRSRREQSLADAADAEALAASERAESASTTSETVVLAHEPIDLTGADVDLTALQQRVDADGTSPA